jgi:hypothetical protein
LSPPFALIRLVSAARKPHAGGAAQLDLYVSKLAEDRQPKTVLAARLASAGKRTFQG